MIAPRRIVVVGQAPSRGTGGAPPFSGASGRKLAELLDVPHAELGALFELRNVLARYPGKGAGKGDAFPAARARRAARRLRAEVAGREVLVVGKATAAALGLDGERLFRAQTWDGATLCWVIPHPSGVNRWWNDAGNRRRAAFFLRDIGAAARARLDTIRRTG